MPAATGYTFREVRALLKLSRGVIIGFVEAGFAHPTRGAHNEYRFTFADLCALRVAQDLVAAQLAPQRILRALRRLREQLPDTPPRRGLRIEAVGDRVIVTDGASRWSADTGQYLLALDVASPSGQLRFLPAKAPQSSTEAPERRPTSTTRRSRHVVHDTAAVAEARAEFEQSQSAGTIDATVYVNLGYALHEARRLDDALAVYEAGLGVAGQDPLLLFNLAVLLEDMQRATAAEVAYRAAVAADPEFADAHYNLALLYESMGRPQLALRHFNAYRKRTRD
ncbi:MAG TPA: tetratricopeptide repeat protein [Casimicrobiaceae bacterium]|nr:tetratricopeptide repeat protein [Casimicrobiaceae bacterium]